MLSLPEVLGWGRHRKRPAYAAQRVSTQKSKAELLGLAQGMLADGMVVLDEARFLRDWIDKQFALRDEWPACALFPRIEEMLSDGVLDAEESQELFQALRGYLD